MFIEIKWKPDKSSKTPLYIQIVDYFKEQVAAGEWLPGYRIPPQRYLADFFNVNRSTVSTAIDELISLGILKAEVGRGTFIENELWNSFVEMPLGWNAHKYDGLFIENPDSIKMTNELLGRSDFINLGSNDLPGELSPTPYIQNVLKDLSDDMESLNYLPPLGHYGLREKIAHRLTTKGVPTTPENILVTSGSVQALHLISLALVKRSTTLFTEEPSYISAQNIFQSIGINTKKITMDEEGISVEKLSHEVKKNNNLSLLYTIPNYQNPTSILMSRSRREELIKCCENNKVAIIEDDAYGDLWFDELPPCPMKSLDKNGLVLHLGTVSQTLSAGLRIGWIAGPEAVVKRLSDVKMQTDYGTSSLSQITVKRLMESGIYDKHLNTLRRRLKEKRDHMLKLLEIYFDDIASWDIPKGGYHIWLKFNNKLQVNKLFNDALKKKLLLDPNIGLDNKKVYAIRLSYSFIDKHQMEPGIKILSDICRGYSVNHR